MSNKKVPKEKLISAIKDLNNNPVRNPLDIEKGRAKYLAQMKIVQKSPVSPEVVVRPNVWIHNLIKEMNMGTLATIMIVLGLLLGGSTATVYAAQDAMPDEMLYPVKIFSEEVREGWTTSPEESLDLALEFANRRIDEILILKEAGMMPPDPVFARLERNINQAIGQASLLNPANLEAALLKIRETLQTRSRLMTQDLEDPTMFRTRTILEQRIQLLDSGIADPKGFFNESRTGWDTAPVQKEGINPAVITPSVEQSYGEQSNENGNQYGQSIPTGTVTPFPGNGQGINGSSGENSPGQ